MRAPSLVVMILAAITVAAQQKPASVPELARDAAVIFRGEVVAVEVIAPRAPDELAEARVTFRVDDGVRGAIDGQMLTIRQWNAAADEYRIGESLVLFLHAPSPQLGLTSPVGGRAGHKRVDEVSAEELNGVRETKTDVVERPPAGTLVSPRPRPHERLLDDAAPDHRHNRRVPGPPAENEQ